MNCNDVRDSLGLMLDREVDASKETSMRDHMRDCGQCYSEWQDLEALKLKLQSYRSRILTPAHLRECVRELLSDHSPPPTAGALKTKGQSKILRLATSMDAKDISLNKEIASSTNEYRVENSRGDFVDEASQSFANSITTELLRQDIIGILSDSGLSPRERDLLRLRFGLDDGRQRTVEQVAELYGVTRERVRQIEAKALRKLRHPSRKRIQQEFEGK